LGGDLRLSDARTKEASALGLRPPHPSQLSLRWSDLASGVGFSFVCARLPRNCYVGSDQTFALVPGAHHSDNDHDQAKARREPRWEHQTQRCRSQCGHRMHVAGKRHHCHECNSASHNYRHPQSSQIVPALKSRPRPQTVRLCVVPRCATDQIRRPPALLKGSEIEVGLSLTDFNPSDGPVRLYQSLIWTGLLTGWS
jgi:hypothetical protein